MGCFCYLSSQTSAGYAREQPRNSVGAQGNLQTSAAKARKIQLVIVAVTQFDIKDYNNDVVKSAFEQRCIDIRKFFEDAMGRDNIQLHENCSPQNTTRESLRHLFSIDLPQFSANTLTLIFIMSHGEAVQFGNEFLSNDLELISSDTKTSDSENDSKGEREFSSILFGSELMSWLQRAPAGSTVLVFLDTCHSGAAASLSTSLTQALQQQFGLRSLVLASALPQDNAYSALFTKELLELWGTQNGCLNQDTLQNDIYHKMTQDAPLTGDEGIPSFVVRYNGPLCLGNFGKDRRLLFLYGGEEAITKPFQYQVSEDLGTSQRTVISDQMQYTYLPIPLDAKKYIVNVKQRNQVIGQWPVDLTSTEAALIWFDRLAGPKDVGKFGEVMAATAEQNGSSRQEIAWLTQRTVAAYHAAGLDIDAKRLTAIMRAKGELVSISDDIKNLAFKPTKTVRNTLRGANGTGGQGPQIIIAGIEGPLDRVSVAEQLELLGDFKNAAAIFRDEAQVETDPKKRETLVRRGYFAYLGAGDVKGANKFAHDFHLRSFPSFGNTEMAAHLKVSPGSLQAMGIASVLNAQGP